MFWELIGKFIIHLILCYFSWLIPIVGIILGLIYIAKDEKLMGIAYIGFAILGFNNSYNLLMRAFF